MTLRYRVDRRDLVGSSNLWHVTVGAYRVAMELLAWIGREWLQGGKRTSNESYDRWNSRDLK